MTEFFVNLPLSFLYAHPEYLDLFISNRICPELGIDHASIDLPGPDWHAGNADRFSSRDIKVSVHMPFMELNPGSPDQGIRKYSITRLLQGGLIAGYYSPQHAIVHTGYRPGMNTHDYLGWLDRSVAAWEKVLGEIEGIQVYVENVYEQDPRLIMRLLERLEGRAGFCFDLGHWFSFGQGSRKNDLELWLECLAPFLKHLHLHDNHGQGDEHLGMGLGGIPFDLFFTRLAKLNISPAFTLEPHNPGDLKQSLKFIKNHPDWFSLLGLKQKDFDHLGRIILPE
jgi:sugar phosphate isomerase/epimerase